MPIPSPKYRTITLTEQPPARIREDQWPVIARGDGTSCTRSDPAQYEQAVRRGECDLHTLRVRLHADGRALVYGILAAADMGYYTPAEGESIRGGEIVAPGASLPAAIRRVGTHCRLPDRVIRECIAALPAQEL